MRMILEPMRSALIFHGELLSEKTKMPVGATVWTYSHKGNKTCDVAGLWSVFKQNTKKKEEKWQPGHQLCRIAVKQYTKMLF